MYLYSNKFARIQLFKNSFRIYFENFTQRNFTKTHLKSNSRWKSKYIITGGLVSIPLLYYHFMLTSVQKRNVRTSIEGFTRFCRYLKLLLIKLNNNISSNVYLQESEEYIKTIKLCHKRGAENILVGCLKNGGLYIKLGQSLVTLNHILPIEYTETLSVLHNKALERKPDELRELFIEEFGKPPEEIFSEFDIHPIAAASLAQVYRAITFNGEEVAVKAQYIDLHKRFDGDCNTINILLKIIGVIHPDFDFTWAFNLLNENLRQELDFINEGKNMERCALELSHLPFVHVPKVYWNLSTKRILTAEYINGVKLDNQKAIKNLGLQLADVDEKLVLTFAEQIFHTGFVHADPHPGNIYIRKDKKTGKAEIVLLDHGLYEYLPEENRLSLCKLWKSIILNDHVGMKKHCEELGVKDYYLFCEILMQRPLDRSGFHIPNNLSSEDMQYMKKMAKEKFDKIMSAIRSLPSSMLLVFRNINTIRSINKLHGHPIDRYTLMAQKATSGVFKSSKSGLTKKFTKWWEQLRFNFKLRCESIKMNFFILYLRILAFINNSDANEVIGLLL
ncbi:uncharacterized aarF domain-containing protein kinase 5-like [Centruroides sculpturatus]|uniref:uncharacterized aarF domain-containing protein kinase 5-like n=1 Tax=Centruroides sculpturatus TaxID=218467 RepID=UPI000C6DBF18|nr:uncharacterized aarF domain-containing protein kinase 5-like [Centruroides sculpturatus]